MADKYSVFVQPGFSAAWDSPFLDKDGYPPACQGGRIVTEARWPSRQYDSHVKLFFLSKSLYATFADLNEGRGCGTASATQSCCY